MDEKNLSLREMNIVTATWMLCSSDETIGEFFVSMIKEMSKTESEQKIKWALGLALKELMQAAVIANRQGLVEINTEMQSKMQ